MTKKFDPKITKGEFVRTNSTDVFLNDFSGYQIAKCNENEAMPLTEQIQNANAIAAIPEMLDVVRVAKIYVENIEHFDEEDLRRCFSLLKLYIKELDEKHGMEEVS